jgi:uncharacterized protein
MNTADFVFHDGLDFFLAGPKPENTVRLAFDNHQTVKHLIESLGVPHVEVGAVSANGRPVGFDYKPLEGDQIDIQIELNSRPEELCFIADCHLGRLAAYLRMLGFDTLYRVDYQDDELAEVAARENRILLTRDRRLLMRKTLCYGYCPRSLEPAGQLIELIHRYDLIDHASPFSRCMRCNGPLDPVAKATVLHRLKPLTKRYFDDFSQCRACNHVYWKGSHPQHMQKLIEDAKNDIIALRRNSGATGMHSNL